MFNHELRPPIDAYIDWEDNPQLAAYYAEYGKPYGKTPENPSQFRSSGTGIGIGKFLIAIVLLLTFPCTAFLVIGGILYAITGSAVALLVVAIGIAIACIAFLIVMIRKLLKK